MRRGFKTEAEALALTVRKQMGLPVSDALDAKQLAWHVGAEVHAADELIDRARLEELEQVQAGAFSACTYTIGRKHVVVYSPLASPARTQSDIAHEVAHILLSHQINSVQTIGDVSFFTCDADEEQEANWLAGCLLLPRPLLLNAAKRGMDISEIAERYRVSDDMAGFRLRTTGVLRQLDAAKRRGRMAG